MKKRSQVAVYTSLLMIILLVTFAAPGCVKRPDTSGDPVAQPAAPVNPLPPSAVGKPAGTLTSVAGDRSGSQTGQPVVTYGAYALWTGKWNTTFSRYGGTEHKTVWELKQVEINVTGTYDWDAGRVNLKQTKTSGLAIGTWSESPSYQPLDDAGDIEIQQSPDGNSFTGKWRYGSSGDWIGPWNGTRIR
jgi:hypothetical protein